MRPETALRMMRDPRYHRAALFNALDEKRHEILGRDLLPHERQARLPWPQLQAIRRIERAIRDRRGEVITVRMARQAGKNETEAFIEARMLAAWRAFPGSIYIRTAPTYRPQIVNSKLRLEKFIAVDPILRGRTRNREGFIVESGHAQVMFLSAGPTSHVVGATASLCLSVDEAHKIDAEKFDSDLAPFTASTNAPIVMWGVAADQLDLLYDYHQRNAGTDRALEYPASVWCELSPAYAAHYKARVDTLGENHPTILTQYDLVDVSAVGAYLNPTQRAALFSGDHPRLEAPRRGHLYFAVCDVGGESEVDAGDEAMIEAEPERDHTVLWIAEVHEEDRWEPYPLARIVAGYRWVGTPHVALIGEVLRLLQHWHVQAGCFDARGVGEALAGSVARKHPSIEPYKAATATVSEDCYDLLARVNLGCVRFWTADPASDSIRRDAEVQARHTRYQIASHDQMRLCKPTGPGSSGAHIDMIKALTYLRTALRARPGGLMIPSTLEAPTAQTQPRGTSFDDGPSFLDEEF